jgi:CBS domain-containing protein
MHRFAQWIEQGRAGGLAQGQHLLRPAAPGWQPQLAEPLRAMLATGPARVPRFLKQVADNALRHRPPLNWRGALDTQDIGGSPMLDLKLQGTALFVDAARLYALAHGLPTWARAPAWRRPRR